MPGNSENEAQAIYILDCMDGQNNDEPKLMKELELVNACTYNVKPSEVLLSNIMQSNGINLSINDPKSQSEIDKMFPSDAVRFNDATIAEVKGMKHKMYLSTLRLTNCQKGPSSIRAS